MSHRLFVKHGMLIARLLFFTSQHRPGNWRETKRHQFGIHP